MASPQKENGYTPIANEIIEKLARYRLSGQEWQILLVLWRQTYGWHKREDCIPFSRFVWMTEMKRPTVIRAVKKLVSKKILVCIKNNKININKYRFNKDYDQWLPSIKKDTTPKVVSIKIPKVVSKKIPEVVSIKRHSKERVKDNKETIAAKPQAWNWKSYLEEIIKDKQRHIRLIGRYFEYRNASFDSRKEAQVAIRRHLRSAKDLAAFSPDKLQHGFDEALERYPDIWTLDTVRKILTK